MLDTPLVTHPLNQTYLAGIRFFDLARIPAGKIHLAGIDPWRKTHRYSIMTIAIFIWRGSPLVENHLAGSPLVVNDLAGDLAARTYVLPVQHSEDGNLIWRGT